MQNLALKRETYRQRGLLIGNTSVRIRFTSRLQVIDRWETRTNGALYAQCSQMKPFCHRASLLGEKSVVINITIMYYVIWYKTSLADCLPEYSATETIICEKTCFISNKTYTLHYHNLFERDELLKGQVCCGS